MYTIADAKRAGPPISPITVTDDDARAILLIDADKSLPSLSEMKTALSIIDNFAREVPPSKIDSAISVTDLATLYHRVFLPYALPLSAHVERSDLALYFSRYSRWIIPCYRTSNQQYRHCRHRHCPPIHNTPSCAVAYRYRSKVQEGSASEGSRGSCPSQKRHIGSRRADGGAGIKRRGGGIVERGKRGRDLQILPDSYSGSGNDSWSLKRKRGHRRLLL